MRRVALALVIAACGDNLVRPDAQTCWPNEPPRLAFTDVALGSEEVGTTGLVFVPGTDEVLILQKEGKISHYRLTGGALELLGSFVIPRVRNSNDCGLISAAFDPITIQGRYLYVAHCLPEDDGRPNRLLRLDFQPPDYAATVASATTILEVTDPEIRERASSHTLGRLLFDADGVMWVPMGDRGVEAKAPLPSSRLGKILRIIPSRDPSVGGYTPAPGNPFTDGEDVYAVGLRNPWSVTLDHLGRLWIGDVGTDQIEEINVLTAAGQDFGWPTHEGPCSDCGSTTTPTFHWTRSSGHPYLQDDPDVTPTTSRAVFVGPEYLPNASNPYDGRLDHVLLFGDACVGFVRAVHLADDGSTCDVPVGHLTNIVDMRQGPDGYLYAVSFGTCNTGPVLPPGRLVRVELSTGT